MSEFEGSPKTWPPLGMPTGSVRALLTLLVVAVVITRMLRPEAADKTQPEDLLWVETLLIALSHYFTSRRFVSLPPDVMKQLEDDGVIERERQPLFLPRNSIRIIIIGAFGWLGYYLYTQNRLHEHHALSLLSLLAAFLLGAAVRRVQSWWNRGRLTKGGGTWGDLKALIVLLAMLGVAIPEFLGSPEILNDMVHRVALGMMLFYFGSR